MYKNQLEHRSELKIPKFKNTLIRYMFLRKFQIKYFYIETISFN